MRSAMTVLKPEKVMFHCRYEPTGYWWDQVLNWEGWIDENEDGKRKGLVEVVPAREVEYVGAGKRPVKHVSTRVGESRGFLNITLLAQYAHKADIIRLEV
jgi:hypothetical protein